MQQRDSQSALLYSLTLGVLMALALDLHFEPGALAASAVPATAAVKLNGSADLEIATGENVTLTLDFDPGADQGEPAEYRLWVEKGDTRYAYLHPGGFQPSDIPQVSARARAISLKNFKLASFPALGTGAYSIYFDVTVNGVTRAQSRASLNVINNFWEFVEVSQMAGFRHAPSVLPLAQARQEIIWFMGGVAAGDYDNDGWTDLYLTRLGADNLLYRNLGDGTFVNVARDAGVAFVPDASLSATAQSSGASFADVDGDGWLDLLVGAVNSSDGPVLFHNEADGTFSDASVATGMPGISNSMGASFADYDKDGDLDFLITNWTADHRHLLFRQAADGSFTDVTEASGLTAAMNDFTANFADIDNDGWLDLLVAADFGTSQVFINNRAGGFDKVTGKEISGFGMGAAVGDYDNDGDLDWFITGIHDDSGQFEVFDGNRLYRNQGKGAFLDVTAFSGTGAGGWGWGACFADFNNDGFLDLFQVNGFYGITTPFYARYEADASRLFVNDKNGAFIEQAAQLGLRDTGQGRGIVCFDYDRDGDIDLFVANNVGMPRLFENRGLKAHWLHVEVAGEDDNAQAIGTRVYVTSKGSTQMRELRAGNNYLSQNPVTAYFGLGNATQVDSVRVVWPSGHERRLTDVSADQRLLIEW
ncbi:MAG: CRTAC1 family protein [Pseudomonadales bacterium]|nr:CRTAC1 family protein [Pseudomonadales bacterium]